MLTVSSTILQVNHLQQLSGSSRYYNKRALKSAFQSLYKNNRKQFANKGETICLKTIKIMQENI